MKPQQFKAPLPLLERFRPAIESRLRAGHSRFGLASQIVDTHPDYFAGVQRASAIALMQQIVELVDRG